MQTNRWLPDRMAIRLRAIYAHDSAISMRHSPQLDRPSQRALIFSIACFPARVSLRFPTPERES
jgi:hypothetical protein